MSWNSWWYWCGFASSQNTRPRSFITMGQAWASSWLSKTWYIAYKVNLQDQCKNKPNDKFPHGKTTNTKHSTCVTTVCEFCVSSEEGDSGDWSGGQLPHPHPARRELWHGRHSPWTPRMGSVDTGWLLAHQSDCSWSWLCSYPAIDRLWSIKWVCRNR